MWHLRGETKGITTAACELVLNVQARSPRNRDAVAPGMHITEFPLICAMGDDAQRSGVRNRHRRRVQ